MLNMYFQSGVKKFLWFSSAQEGFWGRIFLWRAIHSQGPEGIGEEEIEASLVASICRREQKRFLSVPAQPGWNQCWNSAGTSLCAAPNPRFHLCPPLLRYQTQRKPWRRMGVFLRCLELASLCRWPFVIKRCGQKRGECSLSWRTAVFADTGRSSVIFLM